MEDTDITAEITALIGRVKELPSSLARNKVVSRLDDARVWAKELEPEHTQAAAKAECTCPIGGTRADCPLHGVG